jgi:macrolide-specific efflux system membrane fusion protein
MKLKVVTVVALAAVGVGAVVFAFGGIGAKAASATQYLTATATRGDVTDEVAATGTLAAESTYGLVFGTDPYLVTSTSTAPASDTTWPVTKVNVKVGDTVAKGAVLATSSTASLKTDLATAKNTLNSANISLLAAKTELSDAETAGVLARIRQAKIGVANATNQVTSARRDVTTIQTKLRRASLLAPVAGIVTEVNVSAGADAPTGVSIVVAGSTFTITTDVVERDVAHIEVGQKATVTVTALDQQVTGTVSAISPVASSSSSSSSSGGVVSFPVTIELTGAPANARSGMSADVTVTTASATGVITVPSAALRGNAGNYSVLTLAADGTTTPIPVEVGLVTNTLAEIKSGLAEGTAVVTGTAADLAGTSNGNGLAGGGIAIPGGGGAFPRQIRNGNGGSTTTNGGG